MRALLQPRLILVLSSLVLVSACGPAKWKQILGENTSSAPTDQPTQAPPGAGGAAGNPPPVVFGSCATDTLALDLAANDTQALNETAVILSHHTDLLVMNSVDTPNRILVGLPDECRQNANCPEVTSWNALQSELSADSITQARVHITCSNEAVTNGPTQNPPNGGGGNGGGGNGGGGNGGGGNGGGGNGGGGNGGGGNGGGGNGGGGNGGGGNGGGGNGGGGNGGGGNGGPGQGGPNQGPCRAPVHHTHQGRGPVRNS